MQKYFIIFVKYVLPEIFSLIKFCLIKKSKKMQELKFMVAFFVNFSESLINKLEDKKLTWVERFQLISDLKPVLEIIKDWRVISNTIKQLKEEQRNEIILFVQVEFDIKNDKAEQIVEKALKFIGSLIDLIESLR